MKIIKTYEEFVNESKPVEGSGTKFDLKQFKMYFDREYGFISHDIRDKEIQKFIDDNKIDKHKKPRTLAAVADQFQDYLVSQGLADVQESEVNEGRLQPSKKDLAIHYPQGAKLIDKLNNSEFEKWYKNFEKYIEGDLPANKIEELFSDAQDFFTQRMFN